MLSLFLSLLSATVAFGQQLDFAQYIIHNNCFSAILLYSGTPGSYEDVILPGSNVTRFYGLDAGPFFTDAHCGDPNGTATRAGFHLSSYFYYIVKDRDHFNTAISIRPSVSSSEPIDGFCATAECDDANCVTAFTSPPTTFPPPPHSPPNPPFFFCPADNVTYHITFCPKGPWTTPSPPVVSQIHPGYNHQNKCLDVRTAVYANGTAVQIYDCNGTPAQDWIINMNRGSTKIQLAGTNFCLDAGSSPHNGVEMKIWQCFDNLPAQQWYWTANDRIALEGQGQCLDLTDGVLNNTNKVQTWQCATGNANQVWTVQPDFD